MHGLKWYIKFFAPYALGIPAATYGFYRFDPKIEDLATVVMCAILVPAFTAISITTNWIGIARGLNVD